MRVFVRMLFASLSLLPGPRAFAHAAVDPIGHWEGSVKLPGHDLRIAVDIFRNAKGELQATFGEPDRGVKGLPFTTVGVTGRSVRLVLKTAEAVSSFVGEISTDGKTLSGEASQGGDAAPFQLAHQGEPHVAPVPKNAAVARELEGTWNGVLELGDRLMRIVLKLQNQPDGTASGTIMSPDGSGIEIPLAVAQKGASVSLEASSVGASFAGQLAAAELQGSWTQQGQTLPLVFRRAAK